MDEPGFMAMGGQAEAISNVLRDRHDVGADLTAALALAVEALGSVGGENGAKRELGVSQLEVAVLDRTRRGRAFRRIAGAALTTLLSGGADVPEKQVGDIGDAVPPAPAEAKPTVSAAAENLEGDAAKPGGTGAQNSGVAGAGDATGDAVNGDNS
jgi:proteasome alpha subunit